MATEKRLIDGNALKALFDERYDDAFMQMHTRPNIAHWKGVSIGVNWGRNTIADAPTVDAVEVVHGEWLEEHGFDAHNNEYWVHCCSVCEEQALVDVLWREEQLTDYCPYCGAKMNGGKSEQT